MSRSINSAKTFAETAESKMIEPSHLPSVMQGLKEQSKTIATINGSFDLLHAGHLEILYQASLQADILVVGLNTDASIKKYKGPKRPIIPLKYRVRMIAALEMVDFISWFDETDPREWLCKIQPDVHVNGAEYGPDCIEADVVRKYGGRIHLVEKIDGLSTSAILQTLQEMLTCV